MKVLISGATGLVGTALQQALTQAGHEIIRLVRDKDKVSSHDVFWDPEKGILDPSAIQGIDAAVNLSGENIAAGRWNDRQKKLIFDSRIDSTNTLVKAITSLSVPPKVLVNGSAIGFYGDRGDTICTELTAPGSGFLADVCRRWEAAASHAADKGIRTVLLRTGVVLSPNGGALAKMLPPFRLGLGGKLGSGEQYVSWISIDDLVGIIMFALSHNNLQGPINAVAPKPVTNAVLTKALGKVLDRPTILPAPAFALRLLLGEEMANEFLLASTRVAPMMLDSAGYTFKYPDLDKTLKHLLGNHG